MWGRKKNDTLRKIVMKSSMSEKMVKQKGELKVHEPYMEKKN